jgi:phage terminase large subunit-like protein
MVEGESGVLATARPGKMPQWEPSKRRLTWPNGAIGSIYSGEEPDRLRGPQHYDAWIDEPAHIDLIEDVWDNLLLGLRLGKHPRICATTTPKPSVWMRNTVKDPTTVSVQASTYKNLPNLSPAFRETVMNRYEGTRKGRQELYGELIEDVEGALWRSETIELFRADEPVLEYDRIVIAVDPAGTATARSDETGIIIVASSGKDFYVLLDASGRYSPEAWANKVVHLYTAYLADKVVVEKNYGGDMVRSVLRAVSSTLPVEEVTSRRGKALRAEPIEALYEQGRVHHVGLFNELEDQMTSWVPGNPSPDRLDALVHGITALTKTVMPSSLAVPTSLRWRSS